MQPSRIEPRLIVEVCGGPDAPLRFPLAAGERLSIGRGDAGTLALPGEADGELPRADITWDGARARVRCSAGQSVLLSGQPCAAGELTDTAWLRVGLRDFVAYVEDTAPPTMSPVGKLALDVLRPLVGPLFALVDPARDPRLLDALRHAVDEQVSLYDGIQGVALVEVAPHLVRLRGDSSLLPRLLATSWGARATAYLTASAPLAALRRHFRQFLWVRDGATRRRLYFRFHDPAVLRAYLSASDREQARHFFGPIGSFYIEAPDGAVEQLRWDS